MSKKYTTFAPYQQQSHNYYYMEFFECKVRYSRETGDGKMQKANDTYLIEAVTFGDAEVRALEEAKPFAFGGDGIEMRAIKKVTYSQILPKEEGHYWYKAKIAYITVDEEAGKEKKIVETLLVQAINLEDAYKEVQNMMKDATVDYTITYLQETNILDVIRL